MPNYAEQTQEFTNHGEGVVGDCWRTALACLLEIPRAIVPHFALIHKDDSEDDNHAWWWSSVQFVEKAKPGWTLVCLSPSFPVYNFPRTAPKRVVLTGKSPRGDWFHCVIADAVTGEIVWDPHPSHDGILSVIEVSALTHIQKDVKDE